jgi:hypothetical protein
MTLHHAADDPHCGEVRKQLHLKFGPFPGRSRDRAQMLLGEGPDTGANRALLVSQERIRQVIVDRRGLIRVDHCALGAIQSNPAEGRILSLTQIGPAVECYVRPSPESNS